MENSTHMETLMLENNRSWDQRPSAPALLLSIDPTCSRLFVITIGIVKRTKNINFVANTLHIVLNLGEKVIEGMEN